MEGTVWVRGALSEHLGERGRAHALTTWEALDCDRAHASPAGVYSFRT